MVVGVVGERKMEPIPGALKQKSFRELTVC